MAKKKDTPDDTAAAETVTVIATCHLNEGGIHYLPGDALVVSPERADALGPFVKPAPAPDA